MAEANKSVHAEFVKLANEHCDVITPTKRSAVLKAFYFMEKPEYTAKLNELNAELAKLPVCNRENQGCYLRCTSDNWKLLSIFEENNIAIAADDVAHETRSFRVDAPEDELDPVRALAKQFANIDYEVLLYDPESDKNRRGEFVANMVKESGAQGLVLFMQQFCDPEEMEYPYLKKALNDAGVPAHQTGYRPADERLRSGSTAIQAFADVLHFRNTEDSFGKLNDEIETPPQEIFLRGRLFACLAAYIYLFP